MEGLMRATSHKPFIATDVLLSFEDGSSAAGTFPSVISTEKA
jgi:hypothetical protein